MTVLIQFGERAQESHGGEGVSQSPGGLRRSWGGGCSAAEPLQQIDTPSTARVFLDIQWSDTGDHGPDD